MKKIININLSGRVIPIEDSAYEKLQAYIESLRRHFSNEEGRDEIINDIESRVAELMSEKVRKGASCVTEADVEEIISSIGRPEDFDSDPATAGEASAQNQQEQYSYTETRARKRLYRDSSDKFIGGVCSGMAAYLNVDPAIVRILFAIITFGGFGLGFLAYILLWIILPEKDIENYAGKRLYRNPDDRVIGGVAGGLAAYFNSRASTLRLIFAAPILLSILLSIIDGFNWGHTFDFFPNIIFGSLSSTFIVAYIVLWIVLPEARTNYEKMEMRGEKVDLNSIRQNVQEGMGNVKDRMKTWGDEVKVSAQNLGTRAKEFANTRGRNFAREAGDVARTSGRGLGHAIGVIFKVFFFFIVGTIAFAIFVAVLALIFAGIAWWPINNFLWTSNWQQVYAWGTLIFFLGVPLIGFIVWVIRRLIGARSRHSYLGWTFGFLWTIGWVAAILLASSITRDFREYETKKTAVDVVQPKNNRMIVAVSSPELEYTGRFGWINDEGNGWDLTDDTLRLSSVRFNIKASTDSAYHVSLNRYSFGRSEQEALTRADKIQYTVYSRDSVLDLGNGYAVDKESKFRGQQVEIEILVPVGKRIRFDESVDNKLNPYNIRVKRSFRRNRIVDIDIDDDYWRRFRSGVDYEMTIDGSLREIGGTGTNIKTNSGDYRYDDNDSIRIQEEIERKRQELRELEEIKKEKVKPSSTREESMDDAEEEQAFNTNVSPVFSLIKTF
jgi:phage shock protein PspC (stress-responsive transcriptional regulator)